MASSKETYCLCGQPYNVGQFMIECDCCREWFHGSCVDVRIYLSDDIDKYHCPKCAQTYVKIPTNNHRADRYEIGAETRPSQAGTPAWVRALAARPMRPTQAALQRMRPEQFTEEFVQDNGFTRPIIFHSIEGMAPLVEPPGLARRLDWAERVWAGGANIAEGRARPAVQKYCLMSAGGSYTDFHVDFGGTTVWYHVLHGRKVEWYGTAELCAGETLFIPSGWIHAVYTPTDSIVFGGNLLHSYAIEMQLQIYEIESKVETPMMFRYPLFEAMHWYAGAHDEDFTLSETYIPPAQTDVSKRDNVPKCLNSSQLVRELCKELRVLEKRSGNSKEKDKVKNHSPVKSQTKKQQLSQKKSLKLTLPKPIMHMTQNGDFVEEKVYADKYYIDNKEVTYPDRYVTDVKYVNGDVKYANSDVKYANSDVKYLSSDLKYISTSSDVKYVNSDIKYANELPDAKLLVDKEVLPDKFVYQTYDGVYQEYVDKKSLKVKITNSPSSSREEPPPYSLPEHSILKSHLIRSERTLKPIQQWTISKKDIGDYHEEVLYTNENLPANVRLETQDINYGPGMYSAEDIQQDYQYSETAKPGSYQQYGIQPATEVAYDTYRYADVVPTHQVIEEQKPSQTSATPVRRSERAVRRRVSMYPSLEMSSDDDEEWKSPRRHRSSRTKSDKAKSEKDESWSPRARVGRLVPRLRGPARSSVRRECVRAALHAAAQTRHPPAPSPAVDPRHPQ
ncbi:unnamed protein product, partial [Leptidea sinapis]